ncbi:hypothetical protein E0Z10_g8954 [Xylaria hypoxylon]|uniref:Heterokaryon incompatibility domain-containing protein n=1 Tax=Xylaria hypoxylon TaxID=37992 RepID=A0A4Z0YIG2_9PEZI|nr:hypothetical protein E0Z10_g8954 [Xylaria hypoxylon]
MTYSNDNTCVLTSIQEWVVPFFDTKLLSSWLKECENRHAGQCGGKDTGKDNLPGGFRLINTYEDNIIEPNGSFHYVALSYMWKVGPDNNIKLEKGNVDLLATPHSLREVQLPNIITDAITLCRDLGQRYLWIDRLCIVQDDEITKPGQINAMDTIYRSASFTIIGALNTRDDIGLPGSRQLSIASDVFNAFSGVSNALRESFNSHMLFGIPERYIAVCLCWDCPGPFSPRGDIHNVPSWSWVSSSSAVTYDGETEIPGPDFLRVASLIYFHYQDPDGSFRKLDVEERWVQNIISIHELSERVELPPLSGSKGLPGEWRTNRDWKECPQNPWATHEQQALDPDARFVAAMFPGSLVFNTTVASLKIGQPSTHTDSKGHIVASNASLINTNDETVGTLRTMDCRWIETHCSNDEVQKWFEFVVISGRLQDYFKRKASAWEERYSDIWELNVMMVERLPCKPFVSRRIGIGTVTMCKWKDCSPRWETVVLC